MLVHSTFLIIYAAENFDESVVLLNFIFSLMILVDGFIVIAFRKGYEHRWCSFSILFYICANLAPFWMIEISISSLVQNMQQTILSNDFNQHLDFHFKHLGDNIILNKVYLNNLSIDTDKSWLDFFNKEIYLQILTKNESIFCFILIVSRLFLPQAGLTWASISTRIEFSFNTLFDVYSTLGLLREPKLTLPNWIVSVNFCVSTAELLCIALNVYSYVKKSNLRSSPLERWVDNFYFGYIVQIVFADLPFIVTRIIILKISSYNKADILYSIGKQTIIIICKVLVILNHKLLSYTKTEGLQVMADKK